MRKAQYRYKLRSVKEVFSRDTDEFVLGLTPNGFRLLAKFAKELGTTESMIAEALIEYVLEEALDYYRENHFDPNHSKKTKSRDRYGEGKKKKCLTISLEANAKLDKYANLIGDSRSEILECAVRSTGFITVKPILEKLLA